MENSYRPYVSFVILTYNQSAFIQEAIEGALSQDYGDMEIIISDDASTDETYARVVDYFQEHPTNRKVTLNHNSENMGLCPHLNYVISNFVHGNVIVLAGGDDISLPHRVSQTVACFNSDEKIMAVTGNSVTIDKNGITISQPPMLESGLFQLSDEYIRSLSFMCGAKGLAIRKTVWDSFGKLNQDCPTEDSTLRLRSLMLGFVAIMDAVFIKYRVHETNLSGNGNVYKLSTNAIANQYKTDISKAVAKGCISATEAKRLYRKANCYRIERNLGAIKYGKTHCRRIPYKFIQLVVGKMVKWI